MNVESIIKLYLETNGFDGLYNEDTECACVNSDLAPCGEMQVNCCAGYMKPCPSDCGDHDWHICPDK